MRRITIARFLFLSASLAVLAAFIKKPQPPQQTLQGSWQMKSGDTSHLLIATDGYLSHTAYAGKTFLFTKGGPFERKADGLHIKLEYDTQTPDNVGTQSVVAVSGNGNNIVTTAKGGMAKRWTQLDAGQGPLAGAWQITQRMQDGSMQTIHQTGTRKTVKLLTGSMFQWVAIDPGAKGFYGTGGGRYTFSDGKYTEHIGFFSRDSSRVGASLSFSGKVEGGDWHHSGKSSRGDDIHEVWSRGKK